MSLFQLSLFVLVVFFQSVQDSDTLLSFNSNAQTEADAGIQRIVGGYDCTIKEHSSLVQIILEYPTYIGSCGGTLIAWNWVLTAAHCFLPNKTAKSHKELISEIMNHVKILIIAGKTTLEGDADGSVQEKQPRGIHVHPRFDRASGKSDVALVEVTDDFEETFFVKLAKLPPRPTKAVNPHAEPECKMGLAMGWGHTEVLQKDENLTSSIRPTKPQCIQLPLIKLSICKAHYEKFGMSIHLENTPVLCTLYAPGGKDSCKGDSGGPLFCADDPKTIIGIISGSPGGCGLPNVPKQYVKVSGCLTFIEKTMGTYSGTEESAAFSAAVTIKFECHYYCYILLVSMFFNLLTY